MKITRTKEKLAFKAAERLSDILESLQGADILLLLAGGSSFNIYDAIRPIALNEQVTLAMTDDRFSHELDINNFHILQATHFYNEAINADTFVISTEVWAEEKPEELAERFEKGLREWRAEFPKGKVVASFGIGEDGHTCGMIPDADEKEFDKKFQDSKKWVTGYFTPNNEHHERISITMPFIRENVDYAVVYASGEKKREPLKRLLAEKGELHETPARILRELKNVEIFTDLDEYTFSFLERKYIIISIT